jgi:hypothetical protein
MKFRKKPIVLEAWPAAELIEAVQSARAHNNTAQAHNHGLAAERAKAWPPLSLEQYIEVEAKKTALIDQWSRLPELVAEAAEAALVHIGNDFVAVRALDGASRVDATGWLLRGADGEFYPLTDAQLRGNYDEVA